LRARRLQLSFLREAHRMPKTILITGGAGFIGSHLADHLLARGHAVRALDDLSPQVHGEAAGRPPYLAADVQLERGDVRDRGAVRRALRGVDAVFHLAACVGVGQSMYEVERYVSVNSAGTAALLEEVVKRPVERVVVASSMSLYGEGLYRDGDGRLVAGGERSPDRLARRDWELRGLAGELLHPVPTPETKPAALPSVYALTKHDQERLCLTIGRAYDVPAVALRFFNVYGPRQALSNPYTGVLAIFAARFLNGRPPLVNEDGLQRRDFVSVHDVARACVAALESPDAAGLAINVGSGESLTVRDVAERLARVLGKEHLRAEITGRYRKGDVRHCFADVGLARRVLGYEPQVAFEDGLVELAEWLAGQVALDRVEHAAAELRSLGLSV
jgi:dTDP-L-rhamnose 4-epimerase